jgi:two-component system sensor histidine kinase MprB
MDVDFDVEVAPWEVYGDSAGLSRAVLNLMDNAAKWSPSGEHVGVRLRALNATHAELVVSDHGPGIPEQERELVFERFFRSITARAVPGSGLGLAIVKQVVLKHGGQLRVEETVPGGEPPGTSIYVLLPGQPMPAAVEYPSDDEAAPNVNEPSIPGNSVGPRNVISVESQTTQAR